MSDPCKIDKKYLVSYFIMVLSPASHRFLEFAGIQERLCLKNQNEAEGELPKSKRASNYNFLSSLSD